MKTSHENFSDRYSKITSEIQILFFQKLKKDDSFMNTGNFMDNSRKVIFNLKAVFLYLSPSALVFLVPLIQTNN